MTTMLKKQSGRLGLTGYVRILARLHWRPATLRDVAAALEVNNACNLRYLLNTLWKHGFIHVRKWVREAGLGMYVPRYGYGRQPDAPYPGKKGSAMTAHAGTNLIAFVNLLKRLEEGDASLAELSEASGLNVRYASQTVRALREARLARITEWEPRMHCNGTPTALYSLKAGGTDAPRPTPITSLESTRRYQRNRAQRLLTLEFVPSLAANENALHRRQRA
jgi:DNA-binding IscR family transcriptional regulator